MMEKVKEVTSYISTDPSQPVKICGNNTLKSKRILTIPQSFSEIVELHPNLAAMKFKKTPNDSNWSTITYREYHERVEKIAKAFIKLGLEKSGCVAILAFNCPEWFISELAAIHAGYVFN